MPSTLNATTTNGLVTSADNSGSLQLQTNNGTTAVTIDTSQNVGIGTSSPGNKLTISDSGALSIQLASSLSGGSNLLLTANGTGGEVNMVNGLPLLFRTANTERMRITSNGSLLVDTTDEGIGGKGVAINSQAYLGDAYGRINIKKTFSGNVTGVNFSHNNSTVGSISYSNTATAYNTSSDYRLKENIAPMTGALEKVAQLKPVTYNWKADGSAGQGFIAHELQAVVPDCVTGEKDAVELVDIKDEEGNVIGQEEKPVYQGVDTSFLVATLTAAIQELKAELDATKAEVQALKEGKQ